MSDERFYENVACELQSRKLILGLWTKAYAEVDGDEGKARALYIRYRVAQLIELERIEAEKLKKERQEHLEQDERERVVRSIEQQEITREHQRQRCAAAEGALENWLQRYPPSKEEQKESRRVVQIAFIVVAAMVLFVLILNFL